MVLNISFEIGNLLYFFRGCDSPYPLQFTVKKVQLFDKIDITFLVDIKSKIFIKILIGECY
jgi:hypothetical protein